MLIMKAKNYAELINQKRGLVFFPMCTARDALLYSSAWAMVRARKQS